MHKTRGEGETQGELLSVIAGLEPGAIQAVLPERARQGKFQQRSQRSHRILKT
jgi:hypothetical protein